MPFPMKVQPIDSHTIRESIPSRASDSVKPVLKSRLRRLFDRQFPIVLRISSAEKPIAGAAGEAQTSKVDCNHELEPSSVCLAKMVQNFIEERDEKPLANARCGRNRCNCFNANGNDNSDDEFDPWSDAATNGDLSEIIKSLVPCASMVERNLLADAAKIVEQQSMTSKRKDELRNIVTVGLSALGYDASICRSRWDKSSSYPAGEYEYIAVIVAGVCGGGGDERILIDVDFRSEFEIARPSGAYKSILQSLPFIFVGRADRLQRIVSAVSDAARQSLKKKGMYIPPWRKSDYMRAKWLSPNTRVSPSLPHVPPEKAAEEADIVDEEEPPPTIVAETEIGDFELIFGESSSSEDYASSGVELSPLPALSVAVVIDCDREEKTEAKVPTPWQPPTIKRKSCCERGAKVVTGLAALLKENP